MPCAWSPSQERGGSSDSLDVFRATPRRDRPPELAHLARAASDEARRAPRWLPSEKVIFDSEPGISVPAYLLIPHGVQPVSPARAVLCLHGHGRGKDDDVVLTNSLKERQRYVRPLNYDYARQYAERGFVVLAPDARVFGEQATDGMTCTWAMTAGLLLGKVQPVYDLLDASDRVKLHLFAAHHPFSGQPAIDWVDRNL